MIDEVADLLEVGSLTLSLLEDRTWVRRRVETVSIETSETITRNVSLDVDMTEILRRYRTATKPQLFPVDRIPIPVASLPKALFLTFDLTDGSGSRLPLEPSTVDSRLATGALLAKLQSLGFSISRITLPVFEHLASITLAFPADPIFAGHGDERNYLPRLERNVNGATAVDVATWDAMVAQQQFRDMLRTFATNYLPTVVLGRSPGTALVRFGYVESLTPSDGTTSIEGHTEGVLWETLLRVPALPWARSSHTRVKAPPGLMIDDVFVVERQGDLTEGPVLTEPVENIYYHRRLSHDRVAIYAPKFPEGAEYNLYLTLRPERRGILRQAQYLLLASTTLLLAGAAWNFATSRLGHGATEACVVIILLLPSLMLALDAREGEHELVSAVLRGVRRMLALAAGFNVAAAAMLAVGIDKLPLSVAWTVGGLFTLWLAIRLVRLNQFSAAVEESTSRIVKDTQRMQLLRVYVDGDALDAQ